jgi:serine/threonine-protein kinase
LVEAPLVISAAPSQSPAPENHAPEPSEPVVATAAPVPAPALDRVAELRRYVRQFDGGDCFLALPVEVSDGLAKIEAYADSVPPVQLLDEAFRRTNGFEAQIGLRQVTAAQCAAIEFLRLAETDPEAAPRVSVDSFILQNGQSLLGQIGDPLGHALAVLLVADDGAVHDLSDTVEGPPGGQIFRVKLTGSRSGSVKPLLLVVIATASPLATLSSRPLPHADRLFPLLLDEAKRNGLPISAALKYLKLQG